MAVTFFHEHLQTNQNIFGRGIGKIGFCLIAVPGPRPRPGQGAGAGTTPYDPDSEAPAEPNQRSFASPKKITIAGTISF